MYSQRYCGYVGSDMLLDTSNRGTALDYAQRGWAVLPLLPRKKDPHFDLAQRAYLSATTDQKLINFWFDYDEIWSFFESFFGMEYQQIREVLSYWLEETLKLEGYTPLERLGVYQ